MNNVFYANDDNDNFLKKLRENNFCDFSFISFLPGIKSTNERSEEVNNKKWCELAKKFGLRSIALDGEFNSLTTYELLNKSFTQLINVLKINPSELGCNKLHVTISKKIKNDANFYQAAEENLTLHSLLHFNNPQSLKRLAHEWWHFIDYLKVSTNNQFTLPQLDKQQHVSSLREDKSSSLKSLIFLYETQNQPNKLEEKINYYFSKINKLNKQLLLDNPYVFLFGKSSIEEHLCFADLLLPDVFDKLNITKENGREAIKRFLIEILPNQTLTSTAKKYDKINGKNYESDTNEILARGFETWVESKLSLKEEESLITDKKSYQSNLYPQKDLVDMQKELWENVWKDYNPSLGISDDKKTNYELISKNIQKLRNKISENDCQKFKI